MSEDPRCCGSGTCIIDTEGRCWCGQQWDGQQMRHAPLAADAGPALQSEHSFQPELAAVSMGAGQEHA